jgi:putative ABC transport system permease protein
MLEVTRDGTGAPVPVEIVGIVEPAYDPDGHDGRTSGPGVYVPIALAPAPSLTLFAKSRTSAAALMPVVREIVHDLNPRMAFTQFGSLDDVNRRGDEKLAFVVSLSWLATLLGAMALALAGWGLYAVMSHLVAMRSREFAVRMTLGAETRAILMMVGRQAGVLAAIGASIGTFVAIVIGVSIQANWHGSPAASAGAVVMSASLLAAVMLVASLVPAARAARVNPIVLLKDA